MSVKKNWFQKICLILGLYIMTAVMIGYFFMHTDIFPKWMNPYHWNETAYYIYLYSIGIFYFLMIMLIPPPLMTFVIIVLYYIGYPFWELKESVKKSIFSTIYALMIIAFLIFYWTHWGEDMAFHVFNQYNAFLSCMV